MSSIAADKFSSSISKVSFLIQLAKENRPFEEKQNLLHAALALSVALWDGYLKNIVREFYGNIANPLDKNYNHVHTIALRNMDTVLKKFNTPNSENSRNLLLQLTGYEPIGDWIWVRRGWNGQDTRTKLNEILQIRHSFAHGFSLPQNTWTVSHSGKLRLTIKSVEDAKFLIKFLVQKTDRGINNTLLVNYGITTQW